MGAGALTWRRHREALNVAVALLGPRHGARDGGVAQDDQAAPVAAGAVLDDGSARAISLRRAFVGQVSGGGVSGEGDREGGGSSGVDGAAALNNERSGERLAGLRQQQQQLL
jgi:hypothetical protein